MKERRQPPLHFHTERVNNNMTADYASHLSHTSPIIPGEVYYLRSGNRNYFCSLHSISKVGTTSYLHTQRECLFNMFLYIDPASEAEGYITLILRDGVLCNTQGQPIQIVEVSKNAVRRRVMSYKPLKPRKKRRKKSISV